MRRFYALCLLSALLPACKEPTKASDTPNLDAIHVSVRVQPTTVVLGSEASVVLTLKNTTIQPVEISACPIYFWVQNGSGQIVGGSDLVYCIAGALIYLPLRFEALETKTLTFTWIPGETQTVPAGAYDVFGWVNIPAHRSAAARVTVQSAN